MISSNLIEEFHRIVLFRLMDNDRRTVSTVSISDWFNRPQILENGSNIIDQITIGMLTQNIEETDNIFVKEVSKNTHTYI